MDASKVNIHQSIRLAPLMPKAAPGVLLGQLLVDQGALDPADLLTALAIQKRENAALGEILVAQNMADEQQVLTALARQHGTHKIDLDEDPPDPRLAELADPHDCLKFGFLPWQMKGDIAVIAVSRPAHAQWAQMRLADRLSETRFVLTDDATLQRHIHRLFGPVLVDRAETRTSPAESCRGWSTHRAQIFMAATVSALTAGALLAPAGIFALLFLMATFVLALNTLLKLACGSFAVFRLLRRNDSPNRVALAPERPSKPMIRLPKVSILVPLFNEPDVAGALVKRLSRLTYPRELLEICLVVEDDDAVTRSALRNKRVPRWMKVIRVPTGGVKTKPRAMNYALDFTTGDIIGVYDAEDAPAADQIYKVVRRFAEAPNDLACLQGVLSFYNPFTNWLSRCFCFEYAAWFRVMLPGLQRLGFAIPLGGTTLFFRRDTLIKLGGWDAHNVTEDADLGMRLARYGYRCEIIDTVTQEEANSRTWPWIRQRSRWLKGYAVTWAVHMRDPIKLARDLGLWKFMGFQLLFLGTLASFFLAPVLWAGFGATLLGAPHPAAPVLGDEVLTGLAVFYVASEIIMLGIFALSVRGLTRKPSMAWLAVLPVYFILASIAAYKGLIELMFRPFYWDKTEHGEFGGQDWHEEGAKPAPRPSADLTRVDFQPRLERDRQVFAERV
ncbi:glycosyltransferase [Litoreibacter roseus]|uniref:Glycosyl transferase n=1 Tax=Litoreibacter roseus TaxID=2601869 RepID=A0A6N6JKL5_9RHOB|nr:glycosyltransferase [Litoreibacter roseus]GFE65969.1 glycosyl transferase [Litoreibacter roseus]